MRTVVGGREVGCDQTLVASYQWHERAGGTSVTRRVVAHGGEGVIDIC